MICRRTQNGEESVSRPTRSAAHDGLDCFSRGFKGIDGRFALARFVEAHRRGEDAEGEVEQLSTQFAAKPRRVGRQFTAAPDEVTRETLCAKIPAEIGAQPIPHRLCVH
jgi:hypothetical protein